MLLVLVLKSIYSMYARTNGHPGNKPALGLSLTMQYAISHLTHPSSQFLLSWVSLRLPYVSRCPIQIFFAAWYISGAAVLSLPDAATL